MPGNDPWFESIAANIVLSQPELQALQEDGFVVTRGPVLTADLTGLAHAYDAAVLHADPADVKVSTTTTRVQDFVNRGPAFNGLYLHPPLLEACCRIINQPFRLSSVVARAGSMIIYNGSVWHEHGPNLTDSPRRSIQGALIRRTEKSTIDWQSRMRPETLSSLSPFAMYLLGL